MSAALLWFRCKVVGNRWAMRRAWLPAWRPNVDVIVCWWVCLCSLCAYIVGWPV